LWSLVGAQSAFLLGVHQDLGLMVAAAVGVVGTVGGAGSIGERCIMKPLADHVFKMDRLLALDALRARDRITSTFGRR